jgi:hypothetical protein
MGVLALEEGQMVKAGEDGIQKLVYGDYYGSL